MENLKETKVYAYSDQHYGHQNIIKYCNREEPTADLDAISMVKAHNEIITDKDIVIFVGDVSCSAYGVQILPKVIPKLKGKKILIRGNHDRQTAEWYKACGFLDVKDVLIIGDYIFNHFPNLPKVLEIAAERELTLVAGHTHKPFPDFGDGIPRINVAVDVIGKTPKFITTIKEPKRKEVNAAEYLDLVKKANQYGTQGVL